MLHIVPEAAEVPGRCALSQSTTGPFVDSQITIPRHGRLYLSVPYLNSIAAELGWVPAAELVQALENLDDAYDTVQRLTLRVERFEEDVQNVTDAMANFTAEILEAGE